jgi:hypothetical protein
MSILFAGITAKNYIGTPSGISMSIAGRSAYCVPLSFDWLSYGAGPNNTNIAVNINLNTGAGAAPRPPLDAIRSLYIDNTGSAVPVYVQFSDTLFVVAAQPYSAGWYPVFTNQFQFIIVAQGFTKTNIGQCRIFISNVFAPPYTDIALQSALTQELSSLVIGGGSGLLSIVAFPQGQDYNNGNLTISGGGISGATAHGVLDQWGRFVNVVIDDAGAGALGTPIVTATGGQTLPPNFSLTTYNIGDRVNYNGIEYKWNGSLPINCGAAFYNETEYPVGTQVNSGNNIYQCINQSFATPPPPNPEFWELVGGAIPTGINWLSSGSAPGTQVEFSVLLSATQTPITTQGFALSALGDQAQSVIDSVNNTTPALFRSNLWGTPYATGFIYLTHISVELVVSQTPGSDNTYVLTDDLGYRPFSFFAGTVGNILNLQKMNMKLDATRNWSLQQINFAADYTVAHAWAWTYSQN